jgi:hypothetical protein
MHAAIDGCWHRVCDRLGFERRSARHAVRALGGLERPIRPGSLREATQDDLQPDFTSIRPVPVGLVLQPVGIGPRRCRLNAAPHVLTLPILARYPIRRHSSER